MNQVEHVQNALLSCGMTVCVRKRGEKTLQILMETKIQVTVRTEQSPVRTVTDAFKSVNAQKVVSFMGTLFMPAVATQAK